MRAAGVMMDRDSGGHDFSEIGEVEADPVGDGTWVLTHFRPQGEYLLAESAVLCESRSHFCCSFWRVRLR